jgi:hypothetical protein
MERSPQQPLTRRVPSVMNPDKLLTRAKEGVISARELEEVAAALSARRGTYDEYTLIHILGRAGAKQYRSLIESYLEQREDTMLPRLAVQILCDQWNESVRYRDTMLAFARGKSWDKDGDVQQLALSSTGEYLSTHNDHEALEIAFNACSSSNEITREAAFCCLLRASGVEWRDMPNPGSSLAVTTEECEALRKKILAKWNHCP